MKYPFSLVLKYVYKKLDEIEAKGAAPALATEASVFEKLLKIDKHLAVVMAIDMILAGIDTVNFKSNIWPAELKKKIEYF